MDVAKILDDHEGRIRRLEEQSTTMMIRLANIEKMQAETKTTIYETSKENQELMKQMLNTVTNKLLESQEVAQENAWSLIFKVWAVIGPVIGAGLSYLFKK